MKRRDEHEDKIKSTTKIKGEICLNDFFYSGCLNSVINKLYINHRISMV